ncbi:hypothetical protein BC833DRAFT_590447 [Globomyces pollinis-pini]|nr:hypothetical protein BC833DRAFT_590447 [Globomyces pollinis-pini]
MIVFSELIDFSFISVSAALNYYISIASIKQVTLQKSYFSLLLHSILYCNAIDSGTLLVMLTLVATLIDYMARLITVYQSSLHAAIISWHIMTFIRYWMFNTFIFLGIGMMMVHSVHIPLDRFRWFISIFVMAIPICIGCYLAIMDVKAMYDFNPIRTIWRTSVIFILLVLNTLTVAFVEKEILNEDGVSRTGKTCKMFPYSGLLVVHLIIFLPWYIKHLYMSYYVIDESIFEAVYELVTVYRPLLYHCIIRQI